MTAIHAVLRPIVNGRLRSFLWALTDRIAQTLTSQNERRAIGKARFDRSSVDGSHRRQIGQAEPIRTRAACRAQIGAPRAEDKVIKITSNRPICHAKTLKEEMMRTRGNHHHVSLPSTCGRHHIRLCRAGLSHRLNEYAASNVPLHSGATP